MDGAVDSQVAAPEPGTPEYDTAMAAKMDSNDAAALAAAGGADLSAADSVEGVTPDTEAPEEAAEGSEDDATVEEITEALEAQGVDVSAMQAEFDRDGKLSDASYEVLEKAGIDRSRVDLHIEGIQAITELRQMRAHALVGGADKYSKMIGWAAQGYSPEEQTAFNDAVNGSDEAARKQAILAMKQRFESTFGRNPQLLGGKGSVKAAGYESRAQMVADQKDPRYANDPAFRSKVIAKIQATTAF